MAMRVIETPSRIWRRIEAHDAHNPELPSLPSVSEFDEPQSDTSGDILPPVHSTPTVSSHSTTRTSIAPSTTSSQTRFANSMMASRSTKGSGRNLPAEDSFEVSRIEPNGDDGFSINMRDYSRAMRSFAADESAASTHLLESSATVEHAADDLRPSNDLARQGGHIDFTRTSRSSEHASEHHSEPGSRAISLAHEISTATDAVAFDDLPSAPSRSVSPVHEPSTSATAQRSRSDLSGAEQEQDITSVHGDDFPTRAAVKQRRTPSPQPSFSATQDAVTPRPPARGALVTPAVNRREFLLSLVDTASRPRLTFPTPHPRPSRRPFATPRPAHPLAQVYTASTPTDEAGDRSSFISTASSHDLTVHARVNASFDPVTARGVAAPSRFDVAKLNTYLHGLNKRLTEENKMLTERLGDGQIMPKDLTSTAEADVESEQAFRSMLDDLVDKLEACQRDLQQTEAELQEERELRANDRERFKSRLVEVEQGVGKIVHDLEVRLEEAQEAARQAQNLAKCLQAQTAAQEAQARDRKQDLAEVQANNTTRELSRCREELSQARSNLDVAHVDAQESKSRMTAMQDQLDRLEAESESKDQDLRASKSIAMGLQGQVDSLGNEVVVLSEKLREAEGRIDDLNHDFKLAVELKESAESKLSATQASNKRAEDALDEATRQIDSDAALLHELRRKIANMEAQPADDDIHARQSSWSASTTAEADALRTELDLAQKEIARLQFLQGLTPARTAMSKAKDEKLAALEKDRDDLRRRLQDFQRAVIADVTAGKMDSPAVLRRLNMTFKAPKTPGGPLADPSWLHNTTIMPGDGPLAAEVERLQRELDRANASIDSKVDKLEDAGLNVFDLSEKLAQAMDTIATLRQEISSLRRKPETKAVEVPGRDDFARTLSSNLRDASNRLNLQHGRRSDSALVVDTKNAKTTEDAPVNVHLQQDLKDAHEAIKQLESELKDERMRLARFAAEQRQAAEDKDNIAQQLRLAKSGMEEIKLKLHTLERQKNMLQSDLRSNEPLNQRSHELEIKLVDNQQTIARLREDREEALTRQIETQNRYLDASERLQQIRQEQAALLAQQDDRQRFMDTQSKEIDSLKRTLARQTSHIQHMEHDRDHIAADGVAKLQAVQGDLRAVRQEAELFGRELLELRQHQSELKRLQSGKHETGSVTTVRQHEHELGQLRLRHNQECKGLFLQIRYLKAKFTRESTMRSDLGYQKSYLLILLNHAARREGTILASIARIGFPQTVPQRKPSSRSVFKRCVVVVMFTIRARKASEAWREHCSAKQAIAEALEDVRRRRSAKV